MEDEYSECLDFKKTKAYVLDTLRDAHEPMTHRALKEAIGHNTYLGDAIDALITANLIEDVGGVMISRFKYIGALAEPPKTKQCKSCKVEKPLMQYYQEWAGKPSANCKDCKIKAQKRRGRKKKAQVNESDTFEL